MSAVALSQILIYLAESTNSSLYLFLSLITIGALTIRRTKDSFYQVILFIPLLILTGVISGNDNQKGEINKLSLQEVRSLISKPRVGKEYLAGEATVLAIARGHSLGSKQVTLKFDRHKTLTTFPDLPWAPSSLVRVGAKVKGVFEVSETTQGAVPWSYEGYLSRSGIYSTGKALNYEVLFAGKAEDGVEQFISKIYLDFGASNGLDLIIASLLGRGEVLSKDLDELFKRTSTTHLIVVSGFHVGILSRLSGTFLLCIIRRFPRIFLFIAAEVIGPLFGFLVAIFYGQLIGYSLTVVRALAALLIITLGKVLSRKTSSPAALGVAFIAIQTIWPGSVFEPGCQLTFAALFGLILSEIVVTRAQDGFAPKHSLEAQLKGQDWRKNKVLFEKIFSPIITCIVVGLTVGPISLIWFQKFVPLSPLINVILIPFFTFFVLILGGVALLIYKLIEFAFPLKLVSFFSEKIIELIQHLESLSSNLGLGPVEVSKIAVAALVVFHLILLWTILNYSKIYRKLT